MKIIRKEYVNIMYVYEAEIDDSIVNLEENKDLTPEDLWGKYELHCEADMIKEKDCGCDEEYEVI